MIDLKRSKKSSPKAKKVKKISLKKATVAVVFVAFFSFELGITSGLLIVTKNESRNKVIALKKEEEYVNTLSLIKSAQAQGDSVILGSPPKGYVPKIQKIPIVTYHHISNNKSFPNRAEWGLNVSISAFEEQVKYLADNGYSTVTLFDVYKSFYEGKVLPPKSVVLTFDDGYRDNYEQAFSILKKYKKTGTFFMISGFVNAQSYMTEAQLKEMSDAGMEIEPHSKSHQSLGSFDKTKIATEIILSKMEIEKITGKPAYFLAYPYGSYNEQVISVIKNQGYLLAVTTRGGKDQDNSKPYELSRFAVTPRTDIRTFANLISP